MSKRELVLFSPLPPARSGIADYTGALVRDLAQEFDLYVVISDAQPPTTVEAGAVLRATEYFRHEPSLSKVAHAYQIGNNPGHCYMLPSMERHPGLVTVHDLSLHALIDEVVAGHGLYESYEELMFEAYGQCGLELARQVNRRREHPPVLYTELGFLPVFARRSKGLVTHSQLGGLRLGSCAADRPVFIIPHAYHPRALPFFGPRREVRDRARIQVNLPADVLILMSVGFVTRAKCLDRALGALRILREAGRRCLYVIVGETQPSEYDLLGRIAHYDVGESVIVRGYAPDDEIMAYIAAADILLNLRYPTMGETSGSLTNALAIGSCAMITDIGAYSELPASCAVRVPVAEMTDEGVAAQLLPLVDDPDLRNFYELNSAQFGRVEFDPAVFLSRYISALEQTVFTGNTFSMGEKRPHWQFLSTGRDETEPGMQFRVLVMKLRITRRGYGGKRCYCQLGRITSA